MTIHNRHMIPTAWKLTIPFFFYMYVLTWCEGMVREALECSLGTDAITCSQHCLENERQKMYNHAAANVCFEK